MMGRTLRTLLLLGMAAALGACEEDKKPGGTDEALRQTLFVASYTELVSYDVETGEERPGRVQDLESPVDLQALEDGTLLVNLTNKGQVLVVDGRTMLERARLPSSSLGGKRPVHSYLSPTHGGKRYWLALNDGEGGRAETNSALFIDTTPGSATYLQPVGEVRLGKGHHKAAFSATRERVVISNIADCDDALSVYDYSDVRNIQKVLTLSAADLGWGASRPCAANYQGGFPPAPHGCATSKVSGRAYCNLTSTGEVVSIDLDATPPTFRVLATGGKGGGYTRASPDGRYIYSAQESPREGSATLPGAACQVGQLVVVDASTDTIAREVPLRYRGPDCTTALANTDEGKAEPGHIVLSRDGRTLYLTPAGAFGDEAARVRQELVLDLSVPDAPVQRASIGVGASKSHHADAQSADGRYLFVANNVDHTVSQVDTATGAVVRTLGVPQNPSSLATFGTAEGPSEHTGPIK
jgi:YVTN family beta-propeller protein